MSDATRYIPPLPWQASPKDDGKGQCLGGVEDMTPGMVSGRLAHAQALMRAAITPQGTNIVDPDYGYDLTARLGGRVTQATCTEDAAGLTGQFRRDDRTLDAQVSVSFANDVLVVAATILDRQGPYPLTFSVSNAGAVLLARVV